MEIKKDGFLRSFNKKEYAYWSFFTIFPFAQSNFKFFHRWQARLNVLSIWYEFQDETCRFWWFVDGSIFSKFPWTFLKSFTAVNHNFWLLLWQVWIAKWVKQEFVKIFYCFQTFILSLEYLGIFTFNFDKEQNVKAYLR